MTDETGKTGEKGETGETLQAEERAEADPKGAEPGTQPPQLSRRAKILTPLVMLLVMLGLLELVLQVAAPLPFSSRLWWQADGHVKARLVEGQDPVNMAGNVVAINELGFRGPMPSWTPAPGTLRVATLGGSSTFCYDVTDDASTWPAQLERILSERLEMPVEVVNLGLPGYDMSNSKVNYLFTGRALSPHVVTAYHTWNDLKFLRDIDRSEGMPRDVLSGRSSTGTNVHALGHFFWHSQIVQRVAAVVNRARNRPVENTYTSLDREGSDASAPVGDRSMRWFQQNFTDFARFVRGDGALPVLISQATLAHPETVEVPALRSQIRNNLIGMTLPRLAATWEQANAAIEAVATEEDAVFVDGYHAVPPDLEHMADHVHLEDRGAIALAQEVATTLLADARFQEVVARVRSSR